MSEENDRIQEVIAELVGSGFFDLTMTESGHLLYNLSDNAAEINPEVYAIMMANMTEQLMELTKMGYVDFRMTDDLDVEYAWTPAGIDYLRSIGYPVDESGEFQ